MHRLPRGGFAFVGFSVFVAAFGAAVGCSSDAQTGALVGTGFGAIMGQAIGGNTTGTLIGAGVGAGAGYMIGNEGDRRAAREEQARRDRELERRNREQDAAIRRLETQQQGAAARDNARPTTGTFVPPQWPDATSQMQPFADTIWRVTSMTPPPRRQFTSMTLHFLPNGQVVTTTTFPDGSNQIASETYRVVGNTLIINGSDYLTNSAWIISGHDLTLVNQGFRTVLERVGDGD